MNNLLLVWQIEKVAVLYEKVCLLRTFLLRVHHMHHGLRTPREEKAFTARPKIQSQSQVFSNGQSIFCLPHQLNFSDIFDLCLHWVSKVRGLKHGGKNEIKEVALNKSLTF